MQTTLSRAAACLLICSATAFTAFTFKYEKQKMIPEARIPKTTQKIQAAILLDVSNSMDGLIDQAKAQLWNMVSVMGKAKCGNNQAPEIEIALYEYGRETNSVAAGYVKQISPFTTDLDKLSKDLFGLTTNGGDEFCGQVIYTSLNELKWDAAPDNYKVIFIAGNEDFLQGSLPYTKACALAKKSGVIVNTIYCGDRMNGIREHWNLNAECGTGSFTNIDQSQRIEEMPTPYDSIIFSLNEKLNSTYIGYGAMGASKKAMQSDMDGMNYSNSKSSAVQRAEVKTKSNLYKNESWDLVDATATADSTKFITKLDMKTLPDSLQKKTKEELKQIIAGKAKQRSLIQNEMSDVSNKRNIYLTEEKKKTAVNNKVSTLETAMEKVIREQALLYKMKIE